MSKALECTNISKSFDNFPVVNRVNLSANTGQLIALLGPSGCGKTTTLRLIAGFEWPDAGTIIINERVVASDQIRIPAEDRRVGMVFQEYALFPHLDTMGNVAFGLTGPTREKQTRAAEVLSLVGLADFGYRMPYELSGGQQQRVALARALAPRPEILLLDEPFSNLDAALRSEMRTEVRAILRHAGTTCVFVTHDQEEALSLADEVAVMFDGRIVQIADPQILYNQPNTRDVAAFVGEANFLPGEADGMTVACALGNLPVLAPTYGRVEILIRPENLYLSADGTANSSHAVVLWREFYGHDQRIGLRLGDGTTLIARSDSRKTYSPGDRLSIEISAPVQVFTHQS